MAKTLQIVETAYRATLEEQDDPVLWITHAMKGAGADLGVLLKGNAVNYAVKGQDASGLSFGGKAQTQPPDLSRDVSDLIAKGLDVYIVAEDLAERGLNSDELIAGLTSIPRAGVPAIFEQYERIWHW